MVNSACTPCHIMSCHVMSCGVMCSISRELWTGLEVGQDQFPCVWHHHHVAPSRQPQPVPSPFQPFQLVWSHSHVRTEQCQLGAHVDRGGVPGVYLGSGQSWQMVKYVRECSHTDIMEPVLTPDDEVDSVVLLASHVGETTHILPRILRH